MDYIPFYVLLIKTGLRMRENKSDIYSGLYLFQEKRTKNIFKKSKLSIQVENRKWKKLVTEKNIEINAYFSRRLDKEVGKKKYLYVIWQ